MMKFFNDLDIFRPDIWTKAVPQPRQTRRYIGICLAFVVWAILATLYHACFQLISTNPTSSHHVFCSSSGFFLNLSAPGLRCANAQHAKSSSPTGSVANKLPGRHVAFPDRFALLQGAFSILQTRLSASHL